MPLTHWKKLENPDYIGSYAFQPGERKAVTIAGVRREVVNGPDGKREECTIVTFRENEKPLILNATNGKMIAKVSGTPYVEQWAGHRIVLAVEKVKAFGDLVDAVRVQKDRIAPVATAEYTCADCGQIIKDAAGLTASQIAGGSKKKYGETLCLDCATDRKMKAEEEKGNADNANQDQ